MSKDQLRVLLVNDEQSLLEAWDEFLEQNFGYRVDHVTNGEDALRLVKEAQGQYDVVLIDERLDGSDGVAVMQQIKALYPNVEAIIFTGQETDVRRRAIQAGAFRYLEKPFEDAELAMLIRTAAQQVRLRDIGRAILAERDPQRVLASITGAACSLALADQAAIVLSEQAIGEKVHTDTYPARQPWQAHFKDYSLSERIVETGQIVQVSDTTQDERVNRRMIEAGIRSFVGLPIPSEGGNLGALYVYSRRPRRFEEWGTVAVLQTLAGQAGVAIANARAFQQIQAHADYMEDLVRAGQGLSRAACLEEQLALVWDFVREQLDVSTFFAGLRDELTGVLRFHLAHDEGQPINIPDRDLGSVSKKEWGVTGYVVESGQELYWSTEEQRLAQCASWGIAGIQVGNPCQSCFYLPIELGDEVIGVLSIQSYQPRAFSPILRNAFRALGSQLSAALENTRLLQAEQRASERLSALSQVVLEISKVSAATTSLEFQELLNRTCQEAVELFQVDHSGLVIFDQEHEWGIVQGEYPAQLGTLGMRIPIQGVQAEQELAFDRKALVFSDVTEARPELGPVVDILCSFDIQSILIAPIVHKGRFLGSFSLDAVGRTRQFTSDEVELCKVFAAHVAVAIENARLFSERLEAQERLQALIQVGQVITSTLEQDQVLARVLQAALTAFPVARRGAIHLYDEQDQILRLQADTHDHDPETVRALSFRPGEGIAGWVFQRCQATVVENTWQDSRYKHIPYPQALPPHSMACVPLLVRERIIGTLSLDTQDVADRFDKKDLGLLGTFADYVAIAIENARLFHETRRSQQLLEALDEASRHIRAEKETSKLLHEVVRLAAWLVGCEVGCLFINRPHLEELVLRVTYKLPAEWEGSRLSHSEGLVGQVARTHEPRIIGQGCDWSNGEAMFASCNFRAAAVVPLKHAGKVEAVLFVAASADSQRLTRTDLDILERFAAQAAIALHTSRLMGQEQRRFSQLGILHQVSDYIQEAQDLDKILHVVLTGVTAGYGLGFNRAALLLVDERRERLVGRMGMGHLDETLARRDWGQHLEEHLDDFYQYIRHLEQNSLPPTPVGKRISRVQFPLAPVAPDDILAQAMQQQKCTLITQQDELDRLPQSFVESFEPALPLVIAPLTARQQAIGLLVVDNKFTKTHVTEESAELLLTFADTAAVAIRNAQLYDQAQAAGEKLRSFYEASAALVSSHDPGQVLQDILEQAHVAADATWVSMILIDEMSCVRDQGALGTCAQSDTLTAIRSDGISMQVMQSGKPEIIEDTNEQKDRVNPILLQNGFAAAICLPLSVQGRRIGVMWFCYDQPRRFPEFEVDALQLYVNQAAIVYDSAHRMQELEHLRQAAEKLASVAQVREILQQIVKSARKVLGADSAIIWSYDAERKTFLPDKLVADGINPGLLEKYGRDNPRPAGTANTVIQRRYLDVTDIDDKKYAYLGVPASGLRAAIGVKAFQGIALQEGDETLGVLYVNYDRCRGFGDADQATLETFAYHAALSLKQARLREQLSKVKDAAGIVAQVSVLEDLEQTLRSIAQSTQDVLSCDTVSLHTFDQSTNKLGNHCVIGAHYPEKVTPPTQVRRDSIIFKMLEYGEHYIVQDTATDQLFGQLRFVVDEEVKSWAAMPLKAKDATVGVMFVSHRSRHCFTQEERTNIELFAHQAAGAIRNAQLYDEATRRTQALQALYQAGQAVNSTLALDEILSRIVEQAQQLTGSHGQQALFSNLDLLEQDQLRLKAAHPPEYLAKIEKAIADNDLKRNKRRGIARRAVATGISQLVDDVSQDPDYIEGDPKTSSELAVPIMLEQDVIGVINVEHPDLNAFDEDDRRDLEALATQAALAIKNAQLYRERERQISTLQALYDAGRAITSTATLSETLEQIVRHAWSLIEGQRVDGCFSHLALVEGNILHFAAAYPLEILAGLREKVGDIDLEHAPKTGITGRVAKTGESHNVGNVAPDPDYVEFKQRTQSELAVPIKFDEQVIGVINVEHPKRDAFGANDQQALESLAAQAAIAIRNARQNELWEALNEASKAISKGVAVELRELLDSILEQAVERISWQPQRNKAMWGGIQLYDETSNELCLESVYPPGKFPGLVERLGERRSLDRQVSKELGISGRAVLEGKTQIVPDVRKDQDYKDLYRLGTLSEIDVILREGDKILGVLGLESDCLAAFDEMDARALQSLAELAVIAIHNAQLYDDLRRAQGLVGARTAIAWIGMTSSAWRHSIDKHALTIKEQAQLLRGDLTQARYPEQYPRTSERVAMIERLAEQILDKSIVAPLSREEGVTLVAVNELIGERARQLWQNEPYKTAKLGLDLQLSDDVTVYASPEWLRRAFDYLVDNAVDAVANHETREVTIGTRSANEGVEIFISDTGPGIPREIQDQIGLALIEKPKDAQGLGMGLLMAHAIVQAYEGDIFIASTGPTGTTMVIWLPLSKQAEARYVK